MKKHLTFFRAGQKGKLQSETALAASRGSQDGHHLTRIDHEVPATGVF
jgi:hypothetical protein